LSVLQASHSVLCERRRNLHRTIDSLEQAGSDEPEALASLERYKESERQISRDRQKLYREIGELVQTLAVAHDDESAGGDLSTEAAVVDYAELLRCGYCVPSWASREHGLNPKEQAWVEALTNQAAKDEIKITHTWFETRGGGWQLIATIAPPRHNHSYGVPRPLSNPLWRQRFELDWGQRLVKARRRVAAEHSGPASPSRRAR
jgi:alkylhydroperoxidase family enzyme